MSGESPPTPKSAPARQEKRTAYRPAGTGALPPRLQPARPHLSGEKKVTTYWDRGSSRSPVRDTEHQETSRGAPQRERRPPPARAAGFPRGTGCSTAPGNGAEQLRAPGRTGFNEPPSRPGEPGAAAPLEGALRSGPAEKTGGSATGPLCSATPVPPLSRDPWSASGAGQRLPDARVAAGAARFRRPGERRGDARTLARNFPLGAPLRQRKPAAGRARRLTFVGGIDPGAGDGATDADEEREEGAERDPGHAAAAPAALSQRNNCLHGARGGP